MHAEAVVRAVITQARRHGNVITTGLATGCGANHRTLAYMVRSGILYRPYRGVYVLAGSGLDRVTAVRAALVAVGTGSVASHSTAGWLMEIIEEEPDRIHVSAPTDYLPRLNGVVIHRSRPAPPVRVFRGIRCTDPARTILDMAAICTPSEITSAIDRGLAARILRLSDLKAVARPSDQRRRGASVVRNCLEMRGDIGAPSPSVLESMMARLFRRYGIPSVKAEVHAGPDGRFRIDYAFPRPKIAIELYGYASHHSPEQLAYDVARQRKLTLEGWKVLIYTWQQVELEPARVAAEIRQALEGPARTAVSPRA